MDAIKRALFPPELPPSVKPVDWPSELAFHKYDMMLRSKDGYDIRLEKEVTRNPQHGIHLARLAAQYNKPKTAEHLLCEGSFAAYRTLVRNRELGINGDPFTAIDAFLNYVLFCMTKSFHDLYRSDFLARMLKLYAATERNFGDLHLYFSYALTGRLIEEVYLESPRKALSAVAAMTVIEASQSHYWGELDANLKIWSRLNELEKKVCGDYELNVINELRYIHSMTVAQKHQKELKNSSFRERYVSPFLSKMSGLQMPSFRKAKLE